MKLKICGMKYPGNILEISELLPDYMGFIFWKKSLRFFDGQIPALPKSIKKVGVFVNASLEEIILKINKYDLDVIQLHGDETASFCQQIQHQNIEIIKVFSVDDHFNFEILNPFESVCDYFLFDTKGQNPGGNGITFNWEILKKYHSIKPFFISGGIGVDEINKIKKLNLPIFAIDINSKFETEAGKKNVALSSEAINNVRTKI